MNHDQPNPDPTHTDTNIPGTFSLNGHGNAQFAVDYREFVWTGRHGQATSPKSILIDGQVYLRGEHDYQRRSLMFIRVPHLGDKVTSLDGECFVVDVLNATRVGGLSFLDGHPTGCDPNRVDTIRAPLVTRNPQHPSRFNLEWVPHSQPLPPSLVAVSPVTEGGQGGNRSVVI